MTTTELKNEFDIYYNSIASNSAPGIDLYEKSVYLTKAQLEVVNNYFNPKGNKYRRGFEGSSKRRADLKELIRGSVSTQLSGTPSDEGISGDSQFFYIPKDVYLILQEKVRVISDDLCVNNTYLKVKPITHDEFNTNEKNPFKKPDRRNAWRVDYYSEEVLNKQAQVDARGVVELISPYTIDRYKFRYVKYPSPIILTDLQSEYPSENLTIDGEYLENSCKLSEHIHREILNRAVEMAVSDYHPADLPIKAKMNNRNE